MNDVPGCGHQPAIVQAEDPGQALQAPRRRRLHLASLQLLDIRRRDIRPLGYGTQGKAGRFASFLEFATQTGLIISVNHRVKCTPQLTA